MKSKAFEGLWIPREVFVMEGLTLNQKVIYAMIQNLSSDQPCYASNHYIGKILNISERQISRQISLLKNLGCIDYSHPRKINGEWEKRKITVRHKTQLVKDIPKVSSGSEESTIPKVSTNNKVVYNKVDNINDSSSKIDETIKEVFQGKEVFKDEEGLFELFWKTIPALRRINKPLTKKHWKVAVHKESVEKIQESMELFVERVEPKFIKTSYNWLKEERWKAVPPKQEKVRKAFRYL